MTTKSDSHATIREIGGEIWAELVQRIDDQHLRWSVKSQVVEIIMGVLARHEGTVIINDAGLEVEPLPRLRGE